MISDYLLKRLEMNQLHNSLIYKHAFYTNGTLKIADNFFKFEITHYCQIFPDKND
jgi:hypothetical protein